MAEFSTSFETTLENSRLDRIQRGLDTSDNDDNEDILTYLRRVTEFDESLETLYQHLKRVDLVNNDRFCIILPFASHQLHWILSTIVFLQHHYNDTSFIVIVIESEMELHLESSSPELSSFISKGMLDFCLLPSYSLTRKKVALKDFLASVSLVTILIHRDTKVPERIYSSLDGTRVYSSEESLDFIDEFVTSYYPYLRLPEQPYINIPSMLLSLVNLCTSTTTFLVLGKNGEEKDFSLNTRALGEYCTHLTNTVLLNDSSDDSFWSCFILGTTTTTVIPLDSTSTISITSVNKLIQHALSDKFIAESAVETTTTLFDAESHYVGSFIHDSESSSEMTLAGWLSLLRLRQSIGFHFTIEQLKKLTAYFTEGITTVSFEDSNTLHDLQVMLGNTSTVSRSRTLEEEVPSPLPPLNDDAVIVLESRVRFSQSILWKLSRGYYEDFGTSVWEHEDDSSNSTTTDNMIPSYITTNSFIANYYASAIKSFINKSNSAFTYVLELGAGNGKFGFLVLKELMPVSNFCYVLTDFTEKNVRWMQRQPQLREFVNAGVLDFAVMNAQDDTKVFLLEQQVVLSKEEHHNENEFSIILVANYLFDSLDSDVFITRDNNMLYQGLVTTTLNITGLDNDTSETEMHHDTNEDWILLAQASDGRNSLASRLEYHFDYELFEGYDNTNNAALWNKVLQKYCCSGKGQQLPSHTFFLPIGAFNCIENMTDIVLKKDEDISSSSSIYVLCSDKGFASVDEALYKSVDCIKPYVDFHGMSISVSIFFELLSDFVSVLGDSYNAMTSSTFSTPYNYDTCIKTRAWTLGKGFSSSSPINPIASFTPDDFYTLVHSVNFRSLGLEDLLSLLKLGRYDSEVFYKFASSICQRVLSIHCTKRKTVELTLEKVVNVFYMSSSDNDILLELGRVAICCELYVQGIKYLREYLTRITTSSSGDVELAFYQQHRRTEGYYLLGLCFYLLKLPKYQPHMIQSWRQCKSLDESQEFWPHIEKLTHFQ